MSRERGGGEPDPADLDPADLDPADEVFVRSILAQHAQVDPIPGHVAERLDAALAAAADAGTTDGADAAADAGTTDGADLVTAGSGVSRLRRRIQPAAPRRKLAGPARRLLVAAVGVTVLAGGIGIAVMDRPTSDPASSTAGAAPEAEADGAQGAASDAGPAEVPAESPITITASGRDYGAGSLPAAVGLLLSADANGPQPAPESVARPDAQTRADGAARPEREVAPSGPLDTPPAALDRLRDAITLGVCARALADGGSGQVLAADLARYQGQPAAVLVLPGPDATVVDVWVVGPGCAPGDEQVLARARVPR